MSCKAKQIWPFGGRRFILWVGLKRKPLIVRNDISTSNIMINQIYLIVCVIKCRSIVNLRTMTWYHKWFRGSSIGYLESGDYISHSVSTSTNFSVHLRNSGYQFHFVFLFSFLFFEQQATEKALRKSRANESTLFPSFKGLGKREVYNNLLSGGSQGEILNIDFIT